MSSLTTEFMEHCHEEDPRVAKYLSELDEEGERNLHGILGRFARKRDALHANERMWAYRILSRIRKPNTEALVLTNKILDYLDLNANATLEDDEMELVVEILEIFAHAESDNTTLSFRELQMLYAVLRHLDGDDSHALEADERAELRKALDAPAEFLARQWDENPLFAEFK